MLFEKYLCGQIGDPDSQQNHQQGCHDPEGLVDGQQGENRLRQERAQIDGAMNHHGDRKIVGPPIDPGQQDPDDEHRRPGNRVVAQGKDSR